jgi:hypothetical protein
LIFLTADSPTTIYLQIIDHQIETYNEMHIELQAIMRTGTRIQKYDDKNRYFKFFFSYNFKAFRYYLLYPASGYLEEVLN